VGLTLSCEGEGVWESKDKGRAKKKRKKTAVFAEASVVAGWIPKLRGRAKKKKLLGKRKRGGGGDWSRKQILTSVSS